ncbi:MAG: hypothetical protein NTW21_05415 [Verrucomicrobia bacterium]|nr:hypothetical protein [Verrucomicrobiota bacterium]
MTSTPQIRFSTPAEAKAYQDGLAIVRQKLAGHRQPTPTEAQTAVVAKGKLQVLKKLGRVGYRKFFGSEPPRTMAATTPKPAPAPERTVKTYHCYTTKGLFA